MNSDSVLSCRCYLATYLLRSLKQLWKASKKKKKANPNSFIVPFFLDC